MLNYHKVTSSNLFSSRFEHSSRKISMDKHFLKIYYYRNICGSAGGKTYFFALLVRPRHVNEPKTVLKQSIEIVGSVDSAGAPDVCHCTLHICLEPWREIYPKKFKTSELTVSGFEASPKFFDR